MENICVEAIGRVAQLGELYDARTDQFINLFLFEQIPKDAKLETENKSTKLKYESTNSLKSKFDCLDVSAQIRLPVLSGLIKLEGAGKYFEDTKRSAKSEKVSLIQTIETLKEQININNKGIKCMRDLEILEQIDATHVVVGIQWGGYVFISIEGKDSSNNNIQKIQGSLQGKIAILPLYIRGEGNIDKSEIDQIKDFAFKLYGDIIPEEVPLNLIDAVNFLKKAPTLLKKSNNGKGKQIKYFMTPLSTIRKIWKLDINNNCFIKYIDDSLIMRTVDFFDCLNILEQNLNDFYNDVFENKFSLKPEEFNEIEDLRKQFNLFQVKIQREFRESLKSERSGKVGLNNLETILEKSLENPLNRLDFESSKYAIIKQKTSFLNYLKSLDVIMINRELNLNECRRRYFNYDLYVLFFDYKTTSSSNKTIDFFIKFILENKKNEKMKNKTIFAASEHLATKVYSEPAQSLCKVDAVYDTPNKISLFKQNKMSLRIIENFDENTIPDIAKEVDSNESNEVVKIITILLVGESNVEKFVDTLDNFSIKSLDETSISNECPPELTLVDNQYREKIIHFGQEEQGEYQTYTQNCRTYIIKWGGLLLNIIDTSNIGDFKNPKKNMNKILSFIYDERIDILSDKFNIKIKEINENTVALKEKVKQMSTSNKKLQILINKLTSERDSLKQNYVKLGTDLLIRLEEEKDSLRNDLTKDFDERLDNINKSFKIQLKEKSNKMIELETNYNGIKNKLNLENNSSKSLLKQSFEYKNQIVEENSSKESMRCEINSLKNIIKNLNEKNDFLNKLLEENKKEILKLKEKIIENKKQMTLITEIEMTSLSADLTQLSSSNQINQDSNNEKVSQMDCLKQNYEKLESDLLIRLEEEKDSLRSALKQEFEERFDILNNDFNIKIKDMERNKELALNELHMELEAEKTKSLIELKDQLDSQHKHELESLRHRFKLAISTTSIERTPSETCLENVNLDLVDQLEQERDVMKFKHLILDENRYEELLIKFKKEKDKEIKHILSSIQAEQQVNFNKALNKLSNKMDFVVQELRTRQKWSPESLTNEIIEQIGNKIKSLVTNFGTDFNETIICDSKLQCSCNSIIKEKELEISRLNRLLKEYDMTQSFSVIENIERVSVLRCEVGEIVVIYYEEKFDNYIVFNLNNVLHFLNPDCLESLGLKCGTGEDRKHWTIAEVTDKEYCQARKAQNRYRVAINTKFCRIKAKSWSRLNDVSELAENRSIFSTQTFFGKESMIQSSTSMIASNVLPIDIQNIPEIK